MIILILCVIVAIIIFIFFHNSNNDSDYYRPTSKPTSKTKTQEKGELGELLVQQQGKKHLNSEIYIPFHNITIYNGQTSTQIDHLYLSIYGIFVIETKHYSGWIYGNQYDEFWTETFGSNKKYTFKNPLRQNYGHIKFLENFLTIEFEKFHSIIVFSGNCQIKTSMPNNVCRLQDFCDYILSFKEQIFTQNEIEKISNFLQNKALPKTNNTLNFHIQNIQR